jgi:archaemetzincin
VRNAGYTQTYPGQRKHNILLRRVLKVVSHEIGHIFFINHCIFYKCGMNGSNSLQESDTRPMVLCPVDEKKLRGLQKYDREERYRKLEKFYRLNDLKHDAEFIEKIRHVIVNLSRAWGSF